MALKVLGFEAGKGSAQVDKVAKEVDKLVDDMEVGKVANILDNMVVDIDVPNIKYTGVKIQNININ